MKKNARNILEKKEKRIKILTEAIVERTEQADMIRVIGKIENRRAEGRTGMYCIYVKHTLYQESFFYAVQCTNEATIINLKLIIYFSSNKYSTSNVYGIYVAKDA